MLIPVSVTASLIQFTDIYRIDFEIWSHWSGKQRKITDTVTDSCADPNTSRACSSNFVLLLQLLQKYQRVSCPLFYFISFPFSSCFPVFQIHIFICLFYSYGARGGAFGRGTTLQAGRSRVRFPMVSLEFFIDSILLFALWPWVLEYFLRVKAAGA